MDSALAPDWLNFGSSGGGAASGSSRRQRGRGDALQSSAVSSSSHSGPAATAATSTAATGSGSLFEEPNAQHDRDFPALGPGGARNTGSRGASGTTATSDRRGSVPERSSSGGNKVPGLVGLVRGPLPPRGDGVWRTQARTATTASQPPASATRSVSGGSGAPALASSTASNATVTVRRVVSANAAHGTGSPGRPPAGRSVTLGQSRSVRSGDSDMHTLAPHFLASQGPTPSGRSGPSGPLLGAPPTAVSSTLPPAALITPGLVVTPVSALGAAQNTSSSAPSLSAAGRGGKRTGTGFAHATAPERNWREVKRSEPISKPHTGMSASSSATTVSGMAGQRRGPKPSPPERIPGPPGLAAGRSASSAAGGGGVSHAGASGVGGASGSGARRMDSARVAGGVGGSEHSSAQAMCIPGRGPGAVHPGWMRLDQHEPEISQSLEAEARFLRDLGWEGDALPAEEEDGALTQDEIDAFHRRAAVAQQAPALARERERDAPPGLTRPAPVAQLPAAAALDTPETSDTESSDSDTDVDDDDTDAAVTATALALGAALRPV